MARIGMTLLPRNVAEHLNTPQTTIPGYRSFFNAAVDGRFPAEFANNRWTVAETDLPVIVKAMGLTVAKPVAPAKPARKASAAPASWLKCVASAPPFRVN